jgi:LDH2 family malate/lactate/ureidoglycolate dehydrogenase
MPASYDAHRKQIEVILLAWGMPAANATRTADILSWADLHGVDSHGMSMLTEYDKRRAGNRLNIRAVPKIVRETPVSALVDGDGGLGHVPAAFAMDTAIAKAKQVGMAAVAVRNSAHFGACGYYTLMAAEAGLIGMATTSAQGIRVAPTGGAAPKLGTDPISFAAPGEAGRPFLLDMATTTVAFGKVRNKANEGLPAPAGWLQTKDGQPTTDTKEATDRGGLLTPLGGTRDGSSHKGYGLAAMVNILSSGLSGAQFITDPRDPAKGVEIGHFMLALDPGLFRDPQEFRDDVTRFCNELRATRPTDPDQPVLVAGDPERNTAAKRLRDGIPVLPGLLAKIRALAEHAGAPWMLGN